MSGLTLHVSNQLEKLAAELARIFSENLSSPFASDIVVVPGNGLRRWLTQELARAHGICANVRFPFPQNFFVDLLNDAFGQTESASVYEREAMTWRAWAALPLFVEDPAFISVSRYLEGERAELRGYELSRRIARTFEQYLVFRPEMILRWDAGEGKDWQPVLWREIQRAAPGQHAAALAEKLRGALRKNARVPERVAVFGLATLPPSYLSLLQTLALRASVHLFVLEPTPEWWGDARSRRERTRASRQLDLFERAPAPADEITNPLLTENGRVGRDFLNLIWELDAIDDRKHFVRPPGDTMLHCLQRDLYDLRDGTPVPNETVSAGDHSLQIHSCHSVTRELEVLYDRLLALFENDPALKPGDIVVMMPDVAEYVPFIDAIFGLPENPALKIPYTIADRKARARSGVIDTFFSLLELLSGRFGVSEVFAVLESPAVQRRFEMSDLPLLQRWTQESGIRWGIDAAHRERLGLPAFAENSWRAGIDRMLLGYAMPPAARDLVRGVLPFDEIEGANAELLGHFVDCLEKLFARAADFSQPRPLGNWQRDLLATLDEFLQPDELGQIELTQLRTVLEQMGKIAGASGNGKAVSLEIAKLQLENLLPEPRAGFLSGALTFGALKPAVPAKVICLLGLNDNAFPRRDHSAEFDLIAQARRRGDRNRRDDDRALFLEVLLSARDVFYLSYRGQSVRDNSEQPPSVLVSELIDYLARRFERELKQIPIKHSLQAFSAKNFGVDDSRRFSFSQENAVAGRIAADVRTEAGRFVDFRRGKPGEEWREVELDQLVEFFTCPAEFFVKNVLGLEMPRDRDAMEDREPFVIHSLARYALEQELLEDALSGRDPREAFAVAHARGVLPGGGAGEAIFAELCQNAIAFADALRPNVAATLAPPQKICLELGKFIVTGTVDKIRGNVLIRFRLAKFKAKDFVRIWLEHLARNVQQQTPSLLFGKETGKVVGYQFPPVPEARARLEQLLGFFEHGLNEPLPLFPRTSWAFVERLQSGKKSSGSRPPWLKDWDGSEDDEGRGEKREPHIELAFRQAPDLLGREWETLAREIYLPILQARRPL